MLLKRITIENFMLIAELDVELQHGTYFIDGVNLDEVGASSNGAGKSTLCESIVWCLFDDTLRKGMRKDDVIGPAMNGAYVCVEFENDHGEFFIERFRKHPDLGTGVNIIKNGHEISRRKDNDELIAEIIGVSKKALFQVGYFSSRKERFVDLTPAALLALVSQVVDLDRYDRMIELAKKKISDEKTFDVAQRSIALSYATRRLEAAKKQLATAEANLASFVDRKNAYRERVSEFIAQCDADEEKIKADMLTQEYRDRYEGQVETFESKFKDELNDLRIEVGALYEEGKDVHRQIERLQAREKVLAEKDRAATQTMENLSPDKARLGRECVYCGGQLELNDAFWKKLNEHQEASSEIRIQLVQLRDKIDLKKIKLTEISDTIDEKKQRISVIEIDHENYYEMAKSLLANDDALRKRLESRREERDKAIAMIEEVAVAKPDAEKAQLKEALTAVNEAKEEVGRLQSEYDEAEKKIEIYKLIIAALKKYKDYQFGSFILGLKDRINHLFEAIYDGEYECDLVLKKNMLHLTFKNSSKDEFLPAGMFSDGELTRINKVVTYAMNIVAGVGLVIDDEGLTGMDDSGINAILRYISETDDFGTYLFVGHQPEIKEYFPEGQILTMQKKNQQCSLRD